MVGGFTFIEHFSWDAYNESEDMERHIKAYYERFEYLPITCYADKIHMNRENRSLLEHYHIRTAGKPPVTPSKEMQTEACRREAAKDEGKKNLPGEQCAGQNSSILPMCGR